MNKLEVGMYVRINGFISKIEKLHTSKKGQTYMQFKQPNGMLADMNIKIYDGKASHNIIDLIEEGDYVNGYRITLIHETKTVLYAEDEKGYLIKSFGKEDIETIVTKEPFSSMEYRLGEKIK